MTFLLYVLNVCCSTGNSAISKKYASDGGDPTPFNISKSLAGTLAFLLFSLIAGISFNTGTVLLGCAYGLFFSVSMYCGFMALSLGPMAITSMIATFSVIVPLFFGLTVWDEKLSLYQRIGLIFLVMAIILLNFRKTGKLSKKWTIFAFSTLAANGISSIIQKYHQMLYPGEHRNEFMFSALFTVFVILFVISLIKKDTKKALKPCWYGVAAAVGDSGANYIVLLLAATEKASVLFPVVSVAKLLASWLVGRLFFKEKLTWIQTLGAVSGIAAIVLLNLK